jgi:hypothetical protein
MNLPKYTEAKILRVLNKISDRADKRAELWVSKNTFSANTMFGVSTTTPAEKAVIHFCKMYWCEHYNKNNPQIAKDRNLKVIETSKRLKITRREARALLAA